MSHDTVVGLDVHADSITAAILPPECEHAEMVKLPADLMKVRRLSRRLAEEPKHRTPLCFNVLAYQVTYR